MSKQMSTETITPEAQAEQVRQLEAQVKYYRELYREKNRAVQADDSRVRPLLQEMYDVLVSHHEGDIWSHFVEDLSDFPNLAVRPFTVTFEISVDIEVEAVDEDDAEEKAVEQLEANYTVTDLAVEANSYTREA